MTMQEKLAAHAEIAAEDKHKREAWKNAILPRSFYTIEYTEPRTGDRFRVEGILGRRSARITAAVYRTGGFTTRIRKDTILVTGGLR